MAWRILLGHKKVQEGSRLSDNSALLLGEEQGYEQEWPLI